MSQKEGVRAQIMELLTAGKIDQKQAAMTGSMAEADSNTVNARVEGPLGVGFADLARKRMGRLVGAFW